MLPFDQGFRELLPLIPLRVRVLFVKIRVTGTAHSDQVTQIIFPAFAQWPDVVDFHASVPLAASALVAVT